MASLFAKVQYVVTEGKKLSYIPPPIKNGVLIAVFQRNEVAKAAQKWDMMWFHMFVERGQWVGTYSATLKHNGLILLLLELCHIKMGKKKRGL